MMIKILIVDDEPLARERVRQLLEDQADVEIVGECGSGPEALLQIDRTRPDLIILDVEMPEMDGFEMLRALDPSRLPFVIFVTAYSQYALRAFDVHALDYLVKPVARGRFLEALQRVRSELGRRGSVSEQRLRKLMEGLPAMRGPQSRIAVRSDGRLILVATDEIHWIGAEGNYVRLHLAGRSLRLRSTVTAIESRLAPSQFVRIHRSTIVNVDHIREIQPMFRSEHVVILKNGTRLTLSRSYWEHFESYLQDYGF